MNIAEYCKWDTSSVAKTQYSAYYRNIFAYVKKNAEDRSNIRTIL